MIRSLKARVDILVDDAIARLKGLNVSTEKVRETLERGRDAADRLGRQFGEVGRQGQRGMEVARASAVGAVEAIERLRYRLLAAGAAMTTFTGFAVRAAMNAEAVSAQTNVLFQQSAEAVRQWAAEFGRAMGYSQSTILGLINRVQSFLLSMELGEEQAWRLGRRLIALANDIAAATRKPIDDVVQAMTLALAGQTRALVSMGVYVKKAQLEQQARAMGFRKSFEHLTEYQKALVAMAAIERAASHMTGYAAEHMDLAAVSTRRLREAMAELREEMGRVWIQTWGRAAGVLAAFMERIKDNRPLVFLLSLFMGIGGVIFSVAGQLGMFLFLLNQLTRGRAGEVIGRALAAPFRRLGDLLTTTYIRLLYLGDGLKSFARLAWATATRAVSAALAMTKAALASAAAWVKGLVVKTAVWAAEKARLIALTAQNWLYTAAVTGGMWAHIKAKAAVIAHTVAVGAYTAAAKVAAAAQWLLNAAISASPIGAIILGVAAAITALGGLGYAIYRLVQRFGGFRAAIAVLSKALGGFWQAIKRSVLAVWEAVTETGKAIARAYQAVRDFVTGVPRFLADFGRKVRDSLISAFRAALNWLQVWVNRVIRTILGIGSTLLGWVPWIGDKITEAMRAFDPLQEMIREMRNRAPELAAEAERIANIIRDARPDLRGRELLEQFAIEFRRARPDLAAAVDEYIEEMRKKLEARSPPREGPLRRIREWGASLGHEFARGYALASSRAVATQAAALGRAIRAAVQLPTIGGRYVVEGSRAIAAQVMALGEAIRGAIEGRVLAPGPFIGPLMAAAPAGGIELRPAPSPGFTPVITRPGRFLGSLSVYVNVGGVTVNVPPGASLYEAREAGRAAGEALAREAKEEIVRYLIEVLGAEEVLRMPDEVE